MAGKYSVDWAFRAIDQMSGPLRRMRGNVDDFTGGAAKGLNALDRAASGVGRAFARAGGAAAAIGAVGAAGLATVIDVGSEFEATMMGAVAKFPGEIQRGDEAFKKLQATAAEVGATTEFDAQQAAGALSVYAAAGFTAEQAIASLAGAGDLATVSGLTLDEAASTAADSLSALGLATEDPIEQARNLTRVNDVLAKATSMANTSVTDMAEAIKNGGNIAVKSGQSVETFGAMVAAMAKANIKGAEAGTAIRNAMLRLQNPAAKATRVLDALGVSVKDSDGNMRDIVDIIGDLSAATAGMGSAEKTEALGKLFGAETIGPAIALLDAGADGLAGMRTELDGANGAAAKMAATMRDTTKGDIDGFTSAIDGVKTSIFEVVSGPFRELLGHLTDMTNKFAGIASSGIESFLDWFREALPDIVKWSGRFVRFLAVVGPVLALWKAYTMAVQLAAAAQAALNFMLWMNPIALFVIALVAAAALIYAFWPEISAFFKKVWDGILDVVETVKPFFIAVWEFIVGAVMLIYGPMIQRIAEGVNFIMDNWEPIKAWFAGVWEWISTKASEAASWIMDAMAPLGSFFQGLWDGIKTAFDAVFGPILEAIDYVVGAVRDVGREAMGDVKITDGKKEKKQLVTPHERAASSSSSTSHTSTERSEVTIRDESGRAQMSGGRRGSNVTLTSTGAL